MLPPSSRSKNKPSRNITCHMLSRCFLAALIFRPWRWRRHVPPKRKLASPLYRGTRYCSWLRHYATNRKVAGSIHNVSVLFNWPNISSRTIVLGSTQPLTEMSTRNMRFEVSTAVTMMIIIFWEMTPCGSLEDCLLRVCAYTRAYNFAL
jgi:hypothetical protein